MARGVIAQTRNRKVSLQKGVAQGSCWCPAQGIVRTLLSSLWIRLMFVYPPGIRPLRIGLVPASQSGIRPKILFQQIFGLGIIILGQNFAFCPRTFLSRYTWTQCVFFPDKTFSNCDGALKNRLGEAVQERDLDAGHSYVDLVRNRQSHA